MEAIRVKDKEWQLAGVHYVRTEAMCNGFGVSLEMEFGEDKAGDEYILVLDGIHPVSTCRLHQLNENTGKIERVATLKEYRGQHYGAAAITAAEDWFAERGVKKIFINSRTEAVENGKIIEDGPPKEVFNHPKSDRVREFFAKINRMVEPEYSI